MSGTSARRAGNPLRCCLKTLFQPLDRVAFFDGAGGCDACRGAGEGDAMRLVCPQVGCEAQQVIGLARVQGVEIDT